MSSGHGGETTGALRGTVLNESGSPGVLAAVLVDDLESVLKEDNITLTLLVSHLLLKRSAKGVESSSAGGGLNIGEDADCGDGLLEEVLLIGAEETNVDKSLDELRKAVVTHGSSDDGLGIGDSVSTVVRLSGAHEVDTGDVNELVVLVVLGVVLEGQKDTTAAPAELDGDTSGLGLLVELLHSRRDVRGGDDILLSLDSGLDDGSVESVRDQRDGDVVLRDGLLESGGIVNVEADGLGVVESTGEVLGRSESTASNSDVNTGLGEDLDGGSGNEAGTEKKS
ncbi:hypothetical protein HG531_002492 [Fusarium graminearum]|nr:hypothetical protein HG531_002492 [Fusarium graminearum]